MPYYVFAVKGYGQLDKVAEFDVFRDASAHAKTLRQVQPGGNAPRIKVMFGVNQIEAEDQLLQPREAGPSGDD